jgi:hypothetical protein
MNAAEEHSRSQHEFVDPSYAWMVEFVGRRSLALGDRAYDSDPLDEQPRLDVIEMIAPHCTITQLHASTFLKTRCNFG